jgi:hypothetical protein
MRIFSWACGAESNEKFNSKKSIAEKAEDLRHGFICHLEAALCHRKSDNAALLLA